MYNLLSDLDIFTRGKVKAKIPCSRSGALQRDLALPFSSVNEMVISF